MLQACVAGVLGLHERAQPKNHLNEHIETESQPARNGGRAIADKH